MPSLSRRDFLRLLGFGSLGLLASRCVPRGLQPRPQDETRFPTRSATGTAILGPGAATQKEPVDLEVALMARPAEVALFEQGPPTRVWRFEAQVIQGPEDAVQTLPDTYLGPILHVRRGWRVRIRFQHALDEVSIVHWHGLHVAEVNDGHPRYVIRSGETYVYDFVVTDRAGMYWYHPHPHGRTGPQVYFGLAGLFIVHDDEEDALGLPAGPYDVPLVLQDRTFSADRQLVYLGNGMMDQMIGFLGQQILVNGRPERRLTVEARAYRLRLLNGSNARIYKLAWEDGTPLTVIGTDGGLLEQPIQRDFVTLAPAQRVELVVDFTTWGAGARPRLVSLPHAAPGGETTFSVLEVQVEPTAATTTTGGWPARLRPLQGYTEAEAVNAGRPRTFTLAMTMGRGWTLNGRTFEMTAVARDEIVRLGDLEVWSFVNPAGGMGRGGGMGMGRMGMGMGMMALPHPMHVHGLQFQILRRTVDPAWHDAWATLSPGFVDEGWHDTVLVMPGERVDILLRFADYEGLYLYHCHNLEHEDMGMMRNYRVQKA